MHGVFNTPGLHELHAQRYALCIVYIEWRAINIDRGRDVCLRRGGTFSPMRDWGPIREMYTRGTEPQLMEGLYDATTLCVPMGYDVAN